MRVGIEVIAAGTGLEEGQGGASGYIEGLVPALLADGRIDELIAYVPDWYEPARGWSHPNLNVTKCRLGRSRPRRVAYEQFGIPAHAARDKIDVLLSTGNYRPLTYWKPNVLALHAVQHFLLGDDIGRVRSAYLRFAVPRSARTASRVIAVTETLRRDAIKLFHLDPAQIVSVPMGPSPWVLELMDSDHEVTSYRPPDGSPYVLCISRLYALKNHRRLIKAFASLIRDDGLPHMLVIVGGDADVTRAELEEVARGAGIADRVMFLGRVPQADVPGLYRGAEAIAYVSLYETFGHPVLEAFATGTPLITSTTGATAEVAGGAAQLVNPLDVQEIASGIRAVLTDRALNKRLRAAGQLRVRDFSWSACARGTTDALVAAVDSPR